MPKRITDKKQKFIDRMVTSNTRIKRYLLLNGEETRRNWIPPLNITEQTTSSSAQARVLRLVELLVTQRYPYIINQATEDNPCNQNIVWKAIDRYDRYNINGSSVSIVYDPDTKKFKSSDIPVVVPYINPNKTSKSYFTNSSNNRLEDGTIICTPLIAVSYPDDTGFVKRVDSKIFDRMREVYNTVISNGNLFTDKEIAYIIGIE